MKKKYNIGFIHGRFQIFHNEHLSYALAAKELCDVLLVGITSPDPSTSPHEEIDPHRSEAFSNPCTYYERFKMVKAALIEADLNIDEFDIVPFPIGKPELLHYYVPLEAVSFFTIYDMWGKEKLKRITEFGYKTYILWDDKPKGISGTEIRSLIVNKLEWRKYVPPSVYEYIVVNCIDKRIINDTVKKV